MNKYIGTKEVMAEECTLGAFIAETGRDPYKGAGVEHKNEEPGYKVQYKDGYVSWSPKDVFDKAYKLAETALDRMLIEGSELTTKIEKLEAFIGSGKFKELDETSRAMLHTQSAVMKDYQRLLNSRYCRMEGHGTPLVDLSFGSAIALLEAGFAVCRAGWNGKGMFVVKQVPCTISEKIIPNMQSLPQFAKDILMSRSNKEIHYSNQMLIIKQDGTADSWVPSASDVFATNWMLYTKEDDEYLRPNSCCGGCMPSSGRPE